MEPRVIVAMDYANAGDCLVLARQLDPAYCRVKVGKELFTAAGPAVVESLIGLGFDVFLDLKFHDIPNTVAGAIKAAANMGVWMVNVHASGGRRMMTAAREAIDGVNCERKPLLTAVTVLTSMTRVDISEIGVDLSPVQQVRNLARLTADCGIDGVVCSVAEVQALRQAHGEGFVLVTPGIRLPENVADDQRRVATPVDAVNAGSDYLVIGRPITQSQEPAAVCRQIAAQIQALHQPN